MLIEFLKQMLHHKLHSAIGKKLYQEVNRIVFSCLKIKQIQNLSDVFGTFGTKINFNLLGSN